MTKSQQNSGEILILKQLNNIAELLQKILILQATNAGVNGHEIRKLAGVGMSKVTEISKLTKTNSRAIKENSAKQ